MNFTKITTEDNARYLEHLRKCREIPADLTPSMVWGYDVSGLAPCVRAYEGGLCWQRITEHGETFYYPPLGDWDNVDWSAAFAQAGISKGDRFGYVPKYLKELWEREFPGQFEVQTDRDKWDYIYEFSDFATATSAGRRLTRRFREDYEYTVEEITEDNAIETLNFAMSASDIVKEKHPGENFTELDEDDAVMAQILQNWEAHTFIPEMKVCALHSPEGFIIRVNGKIVSFMINDIIDDKRVICLFNKNDYAYRGVDEAAVSELCERNLARGRKLVNYMSDAGIAGLRQAKLERKPKQLLEKYWMQWE